MPERVVQPYEREADQKILLGIELRILVFEAVKDGIDPISVAPDYMWHSNRIAGSGFKGWAERAEAYDDDLPSAPMKEGLRIHTLDTTSATTIYNRHGLAGVKGELDLANKKADEIAARLGTARKPLQRVNPSLIPVQHALKV